jgi:predicted acyl esterase
MQSRAISTGRGGGHIVTATKFGDFDLSFEWKIAARGNSGLKYRVRKYGEQTLGPEYQICDEPEGRPVSRKSAGALYDLYEPAADRRFTVDVVTDVMVPMRDGVRLATDIYRPSKDGKPLADRRPIVLIRTPYGKGNGQSNEGKYFASHGYVVIVQDTRGRYRSEGVRHWMTDDGSDGFDCAAWIAEQPWSDGRIGMMGTSYVGGTQHALAMSGSQHLKTVIPVDAVSNMGRQSMWNAGAFEMRFWNWILLNAAKGSSAARDEATAAVLAEMVKPCRRQSQRGYALRSAAESREQCNGNRNRPHTSMSRSIAMRLFDKKLKQKMRNNFRIRSPYYWKKSEWIVPTCHPFANAVPGK